MMCYDVIQYRFCHTTPHHSTPQHISSHYTHYTTNRTPHNRTPHCNFEVRGLVNKVILGVFYLLATVVSLRDAEGSKTPFCHPVA